MTDSNRKICVPIMGQLNDSGRFTKILTFPNFCVGLKQCEIGWGRLVLGTYTGLKKTNKNLIKPVYISAKVI